jgi:hypothetical protein
MGSSFVRVSRARHDGASAIVNKAEKKRKDLRPSPAHTQLQVTKSCFRDYGGDFWILHARKTYFHAVFV